MLTNQENTLSWRCCNLLHLIIACCCSAIFCSFTKGEDQMKHPRHISFSANEVSDASLC